MKFNYLSVPVIYLLLAPKSIYMITIGPAKQPWREWVKSHKSWQKAKQYLHFEGLIQDCNNSIANAPELLQSCTKPSIWCYTVYLEGLVQDCSNSIANALELVQSCTKPSVWCYTVYLEGLAQDCSNSIANALELLQPCTKSSVGCYTV